MYEFLDNIHVVAERFKVAEPQNQRVITSLLCENIIWDGKKVRWDWRKPYYLLTKRDKSESTLPG